MDLGVRILVLATFVFGRFFVHNSVRIDTKRIVRIALLFGAGAAIMALIGNDLAAHFFDLKDGLDPNSQPSIQEITISTAVFVVIEEMVKFLPLALYLRRKPYFSMLSDGVLFFGLAGLMFGALEHFFYGLSYGQLTILLRIFLVLFLHAGLTGMVGYFYAKDRVLGNRLRTAWALLFSITLHYTYNMSLFMADRTPNSVDKAAFICAGIAIATGLNCLLIWLFYKASHFDWQRLHAQSNTPVQTVMHSLIY
jgi:RsiW-degrading membrane proteinase PrsW (M82 family)